MRDSDAHAVNAKDGFLSVVPAPGWSFSDYHESQTWPFLRGRLVQAWNGMLPMAGRWRLVKLSRVRGHAPEHFDSIGVGQKKRRSG